MPRRPPETAIVEFRLSCKGLTAKELSNICKDLSRMEGCRPAFRNPAPLDYTVQAVHEILVQMSWQAAGLYIGKKALDKIVDVLGRVAEYHLTQKEPEHKKTVTIYGPGDKPHTQVEVKPEKVRRR